MGDKIIERCGSVSEYFDATWNLALTEWTLKNENIPLSETKMNVNCEVHDELRDPPWLIPPNGKLPNPSLSSVVCLRTWNLEQSVQKHIPFPAHSYWLNLHFTSSPAEAVIGRSHIDVL